MYMYVFISYIRNCCFHNQQRRKLFASLLFFRRRGRTFGMRLRSSFVEMTPRLDPVQALLIMSDDNLLIKQILATHEPDGREIDCAKFIQIIEEILYRATPLGIQAAMPEESKPSDSDSSLLQALSYLVGKISDEMAYMCMANADAHATTVSLLQNLSSFNWDAKLVLLLAAFVLNYGEFWLHIQIHASSKLARKVAMLKQAPELDKLKEQLRGPIMLILDLAKCTVGLMDRPFIDLKDLPELSTAHDTVPAAIYWATRGIVFAAYTTLRYASSFSTLSSGTWEKELSQLVEKMNSFNKRLQDQLTVCYKIIEERRENDAYERLARITEETVHIDNMKVLGHLLSPDEHEPLLVDCPTRRTVNLEALRRKYVLLLISGLIETTSYDFIVLRQIYLESKMYSGVSGGFEIVWIPIVESRQITEDATQQKFINIQASMPWCSVPRLNSISNTVKKLIKEKFRYRNWPILVVLDPQGKVSSHNAFHMMWIWGSFGFPFTRQREKALWQEEAWRLPLIVNGIDANILDWMNFGKYIILYGGDDMQWITQFTATARRVAQAGIPLEMIYVGKNRKKDNELEPLVDTINSSRLSYSLQELVIWFFWTRLESMLFSKVELEVNDEHDPVIQGIEKLLMYDGIGTWALFSKGEDVCFTGHGPTVLHALQKFDEWKDNMEGHKGQKDFLVALKEEYDQLVGADHPCCHWVFDETAGTVPKNMVCPDCHQPMKQHAIYSCSHGP